MDLDSLLQSNRRLPITRDVPLTRREARAHDQFAREFAEQTRLTRNALFGSSK